jgi:hypothetical protein
VAELSSAFLPSKAFVPSPINYQFTGLNRSVGDTTAGSSAKDEGPKKQKDERLAWKHCRWSCLASSSRTWTGSACPAATPYPTAGQLPSASME